MANFFYNSFKLHVGNDTIDLDGDVIKCALLTSSHVPSAGYETFAEVSSDEVSGSGYTAGGTTLTNITWSSTGTEAAYFNADDPLWSDATFTARYAVFYDDTTTFPADVLMCMYDFVTDQFVNNGSFRLTLNPQGLFKIE